MCNPIIEEEKVNATAGVAVEPLNKDRNNL